MDTPITHSATPPRDWPLPSEWCVCSMWSAPPSTWPRHWWQRLSANFCSVGEHYLFLPAKFQRCTMFAGYRCFDGMLHPEMSGHFNAGYFALHCCRQWPRHAAVLETEIRKMHIGNHTVYAVAVLMKFFVTLFVRNNEVNYQRRTDSNGQTRNINGRKNLIATKISESGFEKIPEHNPVIKPFLLNSLPCLQPGRRYWLPLFFQSYARI